MNREQGSRDADAGEGAQHAHAAASELPAVAQVRIMIQSGCAEPNEIARILQANPGAVRQIMELLHGSLGNAFVAQVVGAQDRTPAKPAGAAPAAPANADPAQKAAVEGVQGAGAPLPHLDKIQAAFGRHDVTGIQAHSGGAASSAAKELGANAYATGNHVAFAGAPDLHTAAHEAAHVVQQRSAVSLKATVGAADDAHEREADAVADAVVAGKPAEGMLDKVGSSQPSAAPAAGDAIQRDAAAPSASETRMSVVRAALHHAESQVRSVRVVGTPDSLQQLVRIRSSLREAIAVLADLQLDAMTVAALQPAMDAFSRAFGGLRDAGEDATEAIYDDERALRKTLQLPATAGSAPKPKKGGSAANNDDGGAALLDLIKLEADAAYKQLVDIDMRKAKGGGDQGDNRKEIIQSITGKLEQHVPYLATMIDEKQVQGKGLKPKVEAAGTPIQQIRSWIFGRQDNATILGMFDVAFTDFNAVRAVVGLPALETTDQVPIAQVSGEASVKEKEDIDNAETHFNIAVNKAFHAYKLGAERFAKFSELKSPPPDPSFWEELAKGILTSMLGNVTGPLMKIALKKYTKTTDDMMEFIAGSATDSVEAISGKIADGAFNKVRGENAQTRNSHLFQEGLLIAQIESNAIVAGKVADEKKARTISAATIRAMTDDVSKADTAMMVEKAYQEAAHAYALLNAQQGLNKTKPKDGVSDMAGFFGKPPSNQIGDIMAGNKSRPGDKTGTAYGVGRLYVEVDDDKKLATAKVTKFQLNGLNDDLAAAVLEGANYEIDKLGLPLEIFITPPWFGRHKDHPRLAIDEKGNIRDSVHWESFSPKYWSATAPGGDGYRPQAPNAASYSTPDKLWAWIRHDRLAKDIVELE